MKFQRRRLMSMAILGSLFALSCTYTGKVHATLRKKTKTSADTNIAKKNQPVVISNIADLDAQLQSGKPSVLMIHASWCNACKSSMPSYGKAAEANPDVQFLKIDGSVIREAAEKYQIRGFPTFVFFNAQGEEKHKFGNGISSPSTINDKIKKFIK